MVIHVFHSFFCYRENDIDVIDLEDSFCQRILEAAELLPYTEVIRDPMYEGDGEVSTPDHTTNSEADVSSINHALLLYTTSSTEGILLSV